MTRFLLVSLCSFFTFHLAAQDISVIGFDGEVHTGGSTINKMVDFPADISGYGSIIMNVSLGCPSGGCDPWDRFAKLSLIDGNGEMVEIGRYITPYGNDWCDWNIDVTDYRGYLSGTVELVSHIETWQNGWEIYTEFEFIDEQPSFEYVAITQLLSDDQFIYGDTIFYSVNLPDFDVQIPDNAEEVTFRVINTGHGQGNTNNAAEFSQKTHEIFVNGNMEFTQFLWKNDCEDNPCSPQGGTWEFDRAGWCPGQNAAPWDYDITSLASPGSSVNLDYVLEPFFNLCSPWNPSCSSGTTCSDCLYNSSTHTEPIYKLALQVIVRSSTPLGVAEYVENETDLLDFYPNPSTGIILVRAGLPTIGIFSIQDLRGRIVQTQFMNGFRQQIDLSDQEAGTYIIKYEHDSGIQTERIIIQ